MAFEMKDAAQYRAMSNEELELRRAEVADELENPDSTTAIEQLRSEVGIIKEESERRSAAMELRMEARKAVESGAGKPVATDEGNRKPDIKFVDRTAEALSLHRNSAIYHLKKIEEILGISLTGADDLLYLELSCRFLEYNDRIR